MNRQQLKDLVRQGVTLVDVTFPGSDTVYSYLAMQPEELQPGDLVVVMNGNQKFGVAVVKAIQQHPIFDLAISYLPIIQKIDQAKIQFWRTYYENL
jgi:hypothetical protein